MLALLGLLAAGAHVPVGALVQAERARLASIGVICLAGGTGEHPPAPARHDEASCIACVAAFAPAPPPQAAPVLPPPSAGPALRAAAPPSARAPPRPPAQSFQPRGPPVPV